MNILAIIGARSGSKGVKDKNIRMLNGRHLMGHIIDAALNSRHVNRVVLSTDSEAYAEIGSTYGAEVPFLRPSDLALDSSPEFEYIKFTLDELKRTENYSPDIIVRLFPTVPFQEYYDIDRSIEALLDNKNLSSCVVIAEGRQHPEKALRIKENNLLTTYYTDNPLEITPVARQTYSKPYFRGNIITSRLETILKTESLTGEYVGYHIIPQERALDIDSEFDFLIAERLFNEIKDGKWEI